MGSFRALASVSAAAVLACAGSAFADGIVLIDSFNPAEVGQLNAIGYDHVSGNVYVHQSGSASIHIYTPAGVAVGTIAHPPGNGNDGDLDFLTEATSVGGTVVPAGTLLVTQGETDPQTLYAVNPTTGAVLASRTLAEPIGQLVGGSWDADRDVLVTIDWTSDVIRTFSAVDGSSTQAEFGFGGGWDAFFADVDVFAATGNLYIVSSSQLIIRVLSNTGAVLGDIDVGALGITGMSGIAFDDLNGEAWISSTNGTVYHLGGFPAIPAPCPGDFNGDGVRNTADFFEFFAGFFGNPPNADYNCDGTTDTSDFFEFFADFFGPPCD